MPGLGGYKYIWGLGLSKFWTEEMCVIGSDGMELQGRDQGRVW